ncbi:hypothetical protein HK102_001458 [Quaeritorhiza haematococci]|nr:hypothetical protein HK102_001458 [Quaeritorhiza haematococci]
MEGLMSIASRQVLRGVSNLSKQPTISKVAFMTTMANHAILSPLEKVPIFLGIGLNYAAHAAELKATPPANPILFTKPSSAMQHPEEPIVVPKVAADNQVDYEPRLISISSSKPFKSMKFDTFAPLGPILVSPHALDYKNLNISLSLNGTQMQSSNTRDMIFDVPSLISFLSQGTTLAPGTVILTGTPPGVGMGRNLPVFLRDGDVVRVEIEGIGVLRNSVRYEKTNNPAPPRLQTPPPIPFEPLRKYAITAPPHIHPTELISRQHRLGSLLNTLNVPQHHTLNTEGEQLDYYSNADAGVDAYIAEPGGTVRYLLGHQFRWSLSERPLLVVVTKLNGTFVVAPGFERGRAEELVVREAVWEGEGESEGREFERIWVWQENETAWDVTARLLQSLDTRAEANTAELRVEYQAQGEFLDNTTTGSLSTKRKRVAVDGRVRNFITVGLQQSGLDVVNDRLVTPEADNLISYLRMFKTEAEIALMRHATIATKAAIAYAALSLARPGMSQGQFKRVILQCLEEAGLSDTWALVLFDENAAFPHGTRNEKVLSAEGTWVLVDAGGELLGYQSDITRTWFFKDCNGTTTSCPQPPTEQVAAWYTVRAAQLAAIEAASRVNATSEDVDRGARNVVGKAGYGYGYEYFTHRLGHGIGCEGHEEPYETLGNKRLLKPGMTFTVEPGIYVKGAPGVGFGIRLEDDVMIREGGFVEVFGPMSENLDDPFTNHL